MYCELNSLLKQRSPINVSNDLIHINNLILWSSGQFRVDGCLGFSVLECSFIRQLTRSVISYVGNIENFDLERWILLRDSKAVQDKVLGDWTDLFGRINLNSGSDIRARPVFRPLQKRNRNAVQQKLWSD